MAGLGLVSLLPLLVAGTPPPIPNWPGSDLPVLIMVSKGGKVPMALAMSLAWPQAGPARPQRAIFGEEGRRPRPSPRPQWSPGGRKPPLACRGRLAAHLRAGRAQRGHHDPSRHRGPLINSDSSGVTVGAHEPIFQSRWHFYR
jgi:hypothetical protein